MASDKKFAQDLARSIMASAVKGQNVPMDVQNAAERVQLGAGTRADLAIMMKFRGLRRTGAGAIRGAVRGLRMFGQSVENISREASILEGRADKGTSVDRARFVQSILGEVEKYSKTKLVKELAKDFAVNIGRDGVAASRFMSMFRGALRLGGSVAMVGAAALEWWEARTHRDDSINAARGRNIDAYRSSYVSMDRKAEIHKEALKRYGYEGVLFGNARLDDVGDRAAAKYAEEQTEEELKFIKARRDNAKLLGVDTGAVLAREAAKRGVSVQELTPRERAEIIDAAVDPRLNQRQYLYDEQTQRQLDYEFGTVLLPKTERQREQRRFEIARERAMKDIEKRKEAVEAAREVAMKMRESRTAGERLEHSRAQANARAEFTSFASRHKTWNWG